MKSFSATWILGLVFAVLSCDAVAAKITLAKTPKGSPLQGITIEGEIKAGDYATFLPLVLAAKGANTVFLASSGGDFLEALRIGRLIRRLKMQVWAPEFRDLPIVRLDDMANNVCASSCFFLYVAGIKRAGNEIGVHRPYLSKESYKSIGLSEAEQSYAIIENIVFDYLAEMSVSPDYGYKLLAVKGDEIVWLARHDILENLDGFVPEYQEWFSARCPRWTNEDDDKYRRILASVPAPYRDMPLREAKKVLSSEDRAFIDSYDSKITDQINCENALLTAEAEKARAAMVRELLGEKSNSPQRN